MLFFPRCPSIYEMASSSSEFPVELRPYLNVDVSSSVLRKDGTPGMIAERT